MHSSIRLPFVCLDSHDTAKTSHTSTKKVKTDSNASPAIIEFVEEEFINTSTSPASRTSHTPKDSASEFGSHPLLIHRCADIQGPKDNVPATQDSSPANTSTKPSEKSSKPSSDQALSKLYPSKPRRGYEPPWIEPPVFKTNLDRLPPNSLLAKKRKAEAKAQEGPRQKRSRTQSSKESSRTPGPTAPPRMSTRQTARQNAASSDQAAAGKATSPQPSASSQGTPTEELHTRASLAMDETSPENPESPQLLISYQGETIAALQAPISASTFGEEVPDTPTSGSSLEEDSRTVASLLRGDEVSTPGTGKVEYFARVRTRNGHMDVPVSIEDLTDDVETIEKYAEWVQGESAPISYQDFKSDFGHKKAA